MENEITAHKAGTIEELAVKEGEPINVRRPDRDDHGAARFSSRTSRDRKNTVAFTLVAGMGLRSVLSHRRRRHAPRCFGRAPLAADRRAPADFTTPAGRDAEPIVLTGDGCTVAWLRDPWRDQTARLPPLDLTGCPYRLRSHEGDATRPRTASTA